jgi:hypothetical protein
MPFFDGMGDAAREGKLQTNFKRSRKYAKVLKLS